MTPPRYHAPTKRAKSADDSCAGCSHPRYAHLDHEGNPRDCCFKDEGEQCSGFREPGLDVATLEAVMEKVNERLKDWRECQQWCKANDVSPETLAFHHGGVKALESIRRSLASLRKRGAW